MNVPYPLFGQFNVKVPGEQRPFVLDFAYPKIGIGTEVDGAIWHEREDFKARDQERDQKLANMGWTILRFKEEALDEHLDAVRDTIIKNVVEAVRRFKKAANEKNIEKFASIQEYVTNNIEGEVPAKVISNNLWTITTPNWDIKNEDS